ncbi:AsmA family protein [Humitalea sp. 24SJ18S-53]|uniref:AsmA family protein n=1 Tax=Humitalea sp. 24SJ18S-53 TaxID=3422307 RepID=UPI003D67E66F
MQRSLYFLTAIGLCLLAALWVIPRMLDWERWRPDIAYLAAERLGRPVTITGPIRLVLLPQPQIEAEGIAIGSDGDGDDVSLTARTLRLRVAFLALLANRIEPREIVLAGVDLHIAWPPANVPTLRAPAWLTVLEARIEDGRLRIGDLTLDGFAGRLTTGGVAEALRFEGGLVWRGLPVRFGATLGRAGWDAIAPLDITLAAAGASLSGRGVLAPEGGFEGRIEATGPDLSALLPAPPGAFRATARLTAGGDLLALEDLTLDFQGAPSRGAVALRLTPEPRLDIALAAARLDLDAWGAALRAAAATQADALPLSVDLSAEAATYRGIALRRLRGAAILDGDRLTLTDVSAVLPGEAEVELAGANAGARLELAVRFAAPDLRDTLAALGVPVGATDPARLRRAEGRFRLVWEEAQAEVPELVAILDGTQLSGAGVFRFGARPAVGLGLTLDRLALDGLLPSDWDQAAWRDALAGFDANLRLDAASLDWGQARVERLALDAALDQGRVTLRRATARVAGADAILSGGLALGQGSPRFQDVSLEASAARADGLLGLLPVPWSGESPLAALPMTLRLTGSGPAEAVALRLAAELGELRLETQAVVDLPATRGTGNVTLRHPGAPRLLTEAFGPGPEGLPDLWEGWLGAGSLSLVAQVTAGPQGVASERLDLVAGDLRVSGQAALALDGPRPKLTGRLVAERLPLPPIAPRATAPLPLAWMRDWDAELALRATRVEIPGLPLLEQAVMSLRLAEGVAGIEIAQGRVSGGSVSGQARMEAGDVPSLALELRLAGAAIAGPLFDLPLDVTAGQLVAEATLTAEGSAPAALLATLSGTVQMAVSAGVLDGLDVPAVAAAAALADEEEAAMGLRRGLLTGATTIERLDAAMKIEAGRGSLTAARLVAEGGATATATGSIDLSRGSIDLQVAVPPGEGPEVGLRLSGALAAPTRVPEIAAWTRWRAERD